MLLTIRKKSQGWVAWLIVIIIAIPFALFGINSYFEGSNETVVANVDGEKINARTLENRMEQRRRFFRSQMGDNFNPALIDNPTARRQVVEELIANRLIQQYAQDKGLNLSDAALSKLITDTPQFQVDGKFDLETYRRLVSARGYSTEGFEQQQRISGSINQLRTALSASALVDPNEVMHLLALNLQQRDADYTLLAVSDVLPEVSVTEEEMRDEYSQNEIDYQQAERIKLNYIELNLDTVAKDIELDDEEIEQAYGVSKGRYTTPEARKASHILFAVPRSAGDAKQQDVLKQANNVLARLKAGEDFAVLAEQFSEDPGSKRQGGDLGVIAKGQMVSAFENAVFAMAQDEISEPIKTEFGYHLIKLTSLSAETQKPLAEVKDEVESAEKQRLARAQFDEAAETLRTLVFESPDSLTEAAEALGLEIQTSEWVTRSLGKKHFANANLRTAAFDAAVVDDDLNSEVISLDENNLIALHKDEWQASIIKPFDEVSELITAKLERQKATELTQQRGQELLASIKAGKVLDDIEFFILPTLKDEATTANDRQVASQVFKQILPDGDTMAVDGFALANGDFAVFRLKSITPGEPENASEAQRQQLVRQLELRDSNHANTLFTQALRQDADVEIFSSLLEDDTDLSNY